MILILVNWFSQWGQMQTYIVLSFLMLKHCSLRASALHSSPPSYAVVICCSTPCELHHVFVFYFLILGWSIYWHCFWKASNRSPSKSTIVGVCSFYFLCSYNCNTGIDESSIENRLEASWISRSIYIVRLVRFFTSVMSERTWSTSLKNCGFRVRVAVYHFDVGNQPLKLEGVDRNFLLLLH